MSRRRKPMAVRKPCGRIWLQPQLPPPTETRRLMDAAVAGMRAAEWGTMLGRLKLYGSLTETEYNAGLRWSSLAADYSQAQCSQRLPQSAKLEPGGGNAADPDSAKGAREARRQARIIESYETSAEVLKRAGVVPERVVIAVCEHDLAPAGFSEIEALKAGLQLLAAFWMAKGRRMKPSVFKPSVVKP